MTQHLKMYKGNGTK